MEQHAWPAIRRTIRRDIIATAIPTLRVELSQIPDSTLGRCAQKVQMLLDEVLRADHQLEMSQRAFAQTVWTAQIKELVRTFVEESTTVCT